MFESSTEAVHGCATLCASREIKRIIARIAPGDWEAIGRAR
jgi:hypothetical protein